MVVFFNYIYRYFCFSSSFFKINYNSKNKFKILITWWKLFFKLFFVNTFFKLSNEKFFGFKVNSFNYNTIFSLFDSLFFNGEYFFDCKTKKPVILDCGANIGFSVLFFKWLYPDSFIYAFEPDKLTFKILKKNVEQNKLSNVFLFNAALYDKDGSINFYFDKSVPGSLKMSAIYERMPGSKEKVKCLSLSSFFNRYDISKIDFIKMDIEGSEFVVIDDLIRNNKLGITNKLIVEYHHMIGDKSKLGNFLSKFEKNGFNYQINAKNPIYRKGFQDIMLYFYK